jgi:hypothetical protein
MNISCAGGDQGHFSAVTAPASDAKSVNWAEGPDPLPSATRNRLWASSGPCFGIPIESRAKLLFESTRRFGANLNTIARHRVCVPRTDFSTPQDNRLARYVLSTRH